MKLIPFTYFDYNYLKKYPVFYFYRRNLSASTSFNIKNIPVWGTNKKHRKVKLFFKLNMGDPQIEAILAPFRAAVKEQGDIIRTLKESKAPELDIKSAVALLKDRKKILENKEMELMPASAYFDRSKMEDLLKRRFYYDQSFSIYGGITGQYDFGPVGCAIKSNLIYHWRQFFILREQMLEVDCTILTPEPVLKASGHVDRFADLMVKDTENGECFRLDHLIKAHLEKLCTEKNTKEDVKRECESYLNRLDGLNEDDFKTIIKKYNITSPITKNTLSDPLEFNLMFATQIGPAAAVKGYLRPETAQGIFVNFKRLLEFNHGKLPFAAAQIGNAFRNEISPRSGLIRVREFTMAEIEHFCDPNDKSHKKFNQVADLTMTLYSGSNQMAGQSAERMTIGRAVEKALVANETLGYFMARICMFLLSIGIDEDRLRFRQHLSNEMAHYACDCWDAECLTSYGWVECVGCADRSAYDLSQHFKATGVRLAAEKRLPATRTVTLKKAIPNKAVIGKTYKQDMKIICDWLENVNVNDLLEKLDEGILKLESKEFKLTSEMVSIKEITENVNVEEIIPNVIEPSFGIGRIMYAMFEHNFYIRDNDPSRTYISLPSHIAAIKCAILPLSSNPDFSPHVNRIASKLDELHISHKVDDSAGSIGKRYTRSDEIAIPYAITVDFDSLDEPHSVTLRERDSTKQIRIAVEDVTKVVKNLIDQISTWDEVSKNYPEFTQQEATKK